MLQPQGLQDSLPAPPSGERRGAGPASGRRSSPAGCRRSAIWPSSRRMTSGVIGRAWATPWVGEVGLVDLRLQARPLGQMVQRLPEGIRQHADHHVRLGPAAVVMPNRPQQQLALEHAEGTLHHRQLDVGLPELLAGPAGLVAPQQVGTVAGQGRPELRHVPRPAQLGRLGLADGDRHERAGLGEAALEPADALQDLVAFLEPALARSAAGVFFRASAKPRRWRRRIARSFCAAAGSGPAGNAPASA